LRLLGACALSLALLPAATADARLGDLDPSFGGGDGIAELSLGPTRPSGFRELLRLSDGTLLAAGQAGDPALGGNTHLLVARFTAAGTLDPTFDEDVQADGVVSYNPGTGEDAEAAALALEEDGDVLVGGATGTNLVATPTQYLGRLSPTAQRTDIPLNRPTQLTAAAITDVAVLPDGDIALAGWGVGVGSADVMLVARLDADYSPDDGFNAAGTELGWRILPLNGANDARAAALTVAADGAITVAGYVDRGALAPVRLGAVARLTRAGALDTSFGGGDGQVEAPSPFDGYTDVVAGGAGLLAAGTSDALGVLQAFDTAGGLPQYGEGVFPGAATWAGSGERVRVTSTGGAVVVGRTAADGLQAAWLAGAGAPDTAPGGVRSFPSLQLDAGPAPVGAALTPDDRLFVAGTTAAGRGFVARFTPNAPPAAVLSAPAQLRAGAPAEIDAQGSSDPEGEPLRYAFDLDGNGSYEFDGGENPLALRSFATPGTYAVGVRVTDPRGGVATARRQIAVAAGAQVPQPVLGKQGVARPVSGTVRYRLPGRKRFRPMTDFTAIPNGTEIDARKGKVLLTVLHDASGRLDGARFYEGRFIFSQGKGAVPLTTLKLTNGTLSKCRKRKSAGASVLAVASKIPRSSGNRRLWGNGRGKFRTRGRYGAATVRGTKWLTDDRCDGTLVRVSAARWP
jgi:uncharacterized delta-60 repeat protein